jgi:hypothetical protein
MNVLKIVSDHLVRNGFAGLVSDDRECACLVGDLAPCEQIGELCEPGYLTIPKDDGTEDTDADFYISTDPTRAMTTEELDAR